jgi:cation diffusion facilitator CzcD-associated flavoprotein CzcO
MDGSVLTISLSKWMELPGLGFKSHCGGGTAESRAYVASLAKYYCDYVQLRRLQDNFRCGTLVTSVQPVGDQRWLVKGVTHAGDEGAPDMPFAYVTPHVVLATGNCDKPNKLKVRHDFQPLFLVCGLLFDVGNF